MAIAGGNRLKLLVVALLLVGTAAEAQGRGGGGGRGRRGGGSPAPAPTSMATPARPVPRTDPAKAEIVGVVKAIGPGEDRVTIAYDEVQALNWPAGTNSFVVAKTELLKGVTPGEKVRFRLDSEQISSLAPF